MVARYTTKGDGAAVQDPGRANSQRAIHGRNTKKWMEGILDDSDGELDALISKLQPASENAINRHQEINEEDMTAVEGALAVVNLKKEILEGLKDGMERNMSAQQKGARTAAEKKEAMAFLTGEKEKALRVHKGTHTAGMVRAESSALEMAKGTFKQ
ncbi:hypothetical protein MBLNU13_g10726t2 [Cladosporium sp. NU13]